MLPHVQLLAGTVRGWASLILFFVRCLAPVQGRAGVRVLCFFFFCVDAVEKGRFIVSSSVSEKVKATRRDMTSKSGDVLDGTRQDS